MNLHDIKAFFADESELNRDDYVIFTYFFETIFEPRHFE